MKVAPPDRGDAGAVPLHGYQKQTEEGVTRRCGLRLILLGVLHDGGCAAALDAARQAAARGAARLRLRVRLPAARLVRAPAPGSGLHTCLGHVRLEPRRQLFRCTRVRLAGARLVHMPANRSYTENLLRPVKTRDPTLGCCRDMRARVAPPGAARQRRVWDRAFSWTLKP